LNEVPPLKIVRVSVRPNGTCGDGETAALLFAIFKAIPSLLPKGKVRPQTIHTGTRR